MHQACQGCSVHLYIAWPNRTPNTSYHWMLWYLRWWSSDWLTVQGDDLFAVWSSLGWELQWQIRWQFVGADCKCLWMALTKQRKATTMLDLWQWRSFWLCRRSRIRCARPKYSDYNQLYQRQHTEQSHSLSQSSHITHSYMMTNSHRL